MTPLEDIEEDNEKDVQERSLKSCKVDKTKDAKDGEREDGEIYWLSEVSGEAIEQSGWHRKDVAASALLILSNK